MPSWCVLPVVLGKLPLQQTAQQVGHGHALREGRHLDARPHRGCDVEGQARGVEVAFVECIGVALANPRLGVRIRGRTCADADALTAWWLLCRHVGHRRERKSTRLNSSHVKNSYAVCCLKK